MSKKILVIISILIFSIICYCYAQEEESIDIKKKYTISTNDILDITVYGEPDLTVAVRVSPEGRIIYPLLGTIQAAGLTTGKLEKTITDLLSKDYMVNPQVSIFVKEYAKISILGEVKNPGSYQMTENLTLTQAVAIAGGFTPKAKTNSIKIIRAMGDKKDTIVIDIDRIINKEVQDIEIKGNDTIMVEQYGRFSIMGQVARPGVYDLKEGLTVVEAIGLAGGFTSIAAKNATRVIRIENGEKKIIKVPVDSITQGDASRDIMLLEGDTIVVPESFF
jgi:polysaccharide export outer membrane protein